MCIISLINESGEECHRPKTESIDLLSLSDKTNKNNLVPINLMSIEKSLIENEAFSLKYTLVSNDKIFIMDQYLKEARFRENVFKLIFCN